MKSTDDYNPESLSQEQLWALGLSALLTERNSDRHDIMGGNDTPDGPSLYKYIVERDWGIHNRDELLETVDFCIKEGGHNKGFMGITQVIRTMSDSQLNKYISYYENRDESHANRLQLARTYIDPLEHTGVLAWDIGRAVSLCRWGYLIGWFDAQELWSHIRPIARMAQSVFPGWSVYAVSYAAGAQYWRAQLTDDNARNYTRMIQGLMTHPESPWLRVPWETSLEKL